MSDQLVLLLHDAIVDGDAARVAKFLGEGADPSVSPTLPRVSAFQHTVTEGSGRNAKDVVKVKSHCKFASKESDQGAQITPLHIAVVSCYRNTGTDNAIAVLRHLIDAGADVNAKSKRLIACNIPGYNWVELSGTPFEIAMKLRSKAQGFSSNRCKGAMDAVIDIVREQSSSAHQLPTRKVPVVAFSTWQSLLLCDDFSDITFVCSDGELLPAHTCVLGTASDYFRRLFAGPWRSSQALVDGRARLSTRNTPTCMRGVLSFIYTGEIEPDLIQTFENAVEVFSLSKEYLLEPLAQLVEGTLVDSISLETLTDLLKLANLHDAATLKARCFSFVVQNKASALTSPSMLSLSTEQPGLWAELVSTVSQNEPAAKRARR